MYEQWKNSHGISPEQEGALHYEWDAAQNSASTWKPPSVIDKELENAPLMCKASRPIRHFARGDAVWFRGQAAVVITVGDRAKEDIYSIARPLPGGSVQIDEAVSSLRGRRRGYGGGESFWLGLAERQMKRACC